MSDVEQRLRRELRAVALVNRQLHAQLEDGGGLGFRASRAAQASAWAAQLELDRAPGDPVIARRSDGAAYVIEGDRRREVRSGLVAAALAEALGGERPMSDAAIDALAEGVPVEVFESPKVPPFVVVGSRRYPLRGLPLPHPVSGDEFQHLPQGEELNVAAAIVPRARFQEALTGRYQLDRVKRAVARRLRGRR